MAMAPLRRHLAAPAHAGQREVAERGGLAHLGSHSVAEGVKLGRWMSTQRARHRAGRLAPDRIAALHTMLRAHAVTLRGQAWVVRHLLASPRVPVPQRTTPRPGHH